MADLPECLEPARHRDLRGRQTEVRVRRTVVALLTAMIVLALANLFGQRPSDESAAAPGASLTVHAPPRLRDGLLFQARFTIVATQQIGRPTLVLDPGWFDRITLNTVVPEPKTEVSSNERLELTYDPLAPGRRMVVVLSMQINPPGGGFRDQGVDLRDGDRLLVRIPRTVTVFP